MTTIDLVLLILQLATIREVFKRLSRKERVRYKFWREHAPWKWQFHLSAMILVPCLTRFLAISAVFFYRQDVVADLKAAYIPGTAIFYGLPDDVDESLQTSVDYFRGIEFCSILDLILAAVWIQCLFRSNREWWGCATLASFVMFLLSVCVVVMMVTRGHDLWAAMCMVYCLATFYTLLGTWSLWVYEKEIPKLLPKKEDEDIVNTKTK